MKVIISAFSVNDILERVNLINNPLINRYMFFQLPSTIEKTKLWCESLNIRTNRIDFVARNVYGELVSMFGLTEINSLTNDSELYIIIAPNFQGRGIGKKITQWIVNYGFLNYRIDKIYLIIDNENIAASTIYYKCGFVIDDIHTSQKSRNGQFVDITIMFLSRTEWQLKDWKQKNIQFELDSI